MLPTACSTAKEVDQSLFITVEFMVSFVTFFSSKTVKYIGNFYVSTDLTSYEKHFY